MSRTVVVDCGTLNCKAGFADIAKRAPDFLFRSSEMTRGPDHWDDKVSPIQNGYIEDWDRMELLWEYTFKEKMRIDPSDHSILLSEPDCNPFEARRKTLQIFFEKFRVPAFHLANQGLLSLYAAGLSSGLVLHSGHGLTNLMTVRDGHCPTFGRVTLTHAGRKLTEYTQELIGGTLRDQYGLDVRTVDFKLAEKFKEDHGHLLMQLGADTRSSEMVTLDIGNKSYSVDSRAIGAKIGEALINPSLMGSTDMCLAEAVIECITLSDDEDFMDEVYLKNIVLAGGNTMFEGLQERLTAEMDKVKFLPFMEVNVKALPYRAYSNWVGGSVISSLPTFDPSWITKQEYEEHGTEIFRKKCLPY